MPFWLKWVALPIVGLFVLGGIVSFVVHTILSMIFYIAIGAVAVGLLVYGYNKTIGSLPAVKRRKQLERMKRGY
jgi:hypothetical protein